MKKSKIALIKIIVLIISGLALSYLIFTFKQVLLCV